MKIVENILDHIPMEVEFANDDLISSTPDTITIDKNDTLIAISRTEEYLSENTIGLLMKFHEKQKDFDKDNLKTNLLRWEKNRKQLLETFGKGVRFYSECGANKSNYTVIYANQTLTIVWENEKWGISVDYLDYHYQTIKMFDEKLGYGEIEITGNIANCWLSGGERDYEIFNDGIITDLNDCVEKLLNKHLSQGLETFFIATVSSKDLLINTNNDLRAILEQHISRTERNVLQFAKWSNGVMDSTITDEVERIYLFDANFEIYGKLKYKYPNKHFIGYFREEK